PAFHQKLDHVGTADRVIFGDTFIADRRALVRHEGMIELGTIRDTTGDCQGKRKKEKRKKATPRASNPEHPFPLPFSFFLFPSSFHYIEPHVFPAELWLRNLEGWEYHRLTISRALSEVDPSIGCCKEMDKLRWTTSNEPRTTDT